MFSEKKPERLPVSTGLAAVLAAVTAAATPSTAEAQQRISPGTSVCVQAANSYYTVYIVTNSSGTSLMVPNRTAAELNTVVNANGRGGLTVSGDYNVCFGGGGTDGGDSDDGGDDG